VVKGENPMPLFEWNEIYSTGLSNIDTQHQKLFSLINELHDAMKKGKANDVIDKVLKELLEYVFFHFNDEEDLFAKYQYPDFHSHRTEHDALTKKLVEMREKFKAGNTFITSELITFLKSWLTIHILQSDMKFAKYLNTIGNTKNRSGVQLDAG
jgi:hemerythrin